MSDPKDIRNSLIRLGDANPELRESIKPVLARLKKAAVRDMRDANDILSVVGRKIEERIRAMEHNSGHPLHLTTVEKAKELSQIYVAWDTWDLKTLLRLKVIDRRTMQQAESALDFMDRNASSAQPRLAAAPEYVALDKAISQWVRQTESKLNRGDVKVDVNVRVDGVKDTRSHPRWTISITYWYDEVEPAVRVLVVEGDAHTTDELEVSRHDYDLPNRREYNAKSKELYDWSPRDVLALLDRYL